MFFRYVDKFFVQLKYIISLISFVLIFMSCLLFIYWLLHSAKIILPAPIENFIWASIMLFSFGIKKGTKVYAQIEPIMPVLASAIYVLLTYFTNCAMVFLDNNHKRYKQCVENYKANLEQKINHDLHEAFISELKTTNFMILKIAIAVFKNESFLTMEENDLKADEIQNFIVKEILVSVKSEYILKKGISGGSIYFVLSELGLSRDFFSSLVSTSINKINKYMRPKMKIAFYCVSDLMDNLSEFDEKSAYTDRMLELKI